MLRLYLLFILAVSLFWGCTAIAFFGEEVVDKCGGERYTSVDQICDDGILKVPCGNGYYDPKVQFCFENAVVEKCGEKEYNPLNQKCEEYIVLNICGNGYYNPAMQFCSEQDIEIYDKCEGKEYNTLNQKCEGDILLTKCGNDYYNPINQNQKCENDILLTKCGNNYYDPLNQSQKCEDSILLSKCGNDYYNPLNQSKKCEDDILFSKCGNIYYDPLNQSQKCEDNILLTKCGNDYYNPNPSADQFCFDDVLYDKCGNKEYSPETQFCDERDRKIYKKVVIGEQIWMGENLNFSADGTVGKCYKNTTSNCATYGRLYELTEAAKVCPSGWHLPNREEVLALRDFIGSDAGTKLKANSDLWRSNKGTDDFGFAALPGGFSPVYYTNGGFTGEFIEMGERAIFCTTGAIGYFFDTSEELKFGIFTFVLTSASVRCIKD